MALHLLLRRINKPTFHSDIMITSRIFLSMSCRSALPTSRISLLTSHSFLSTTRSSFPILRNVVPKQRRNILINNIRTFRLTTPQHALPLLGPLLLKLSAPISRLAFILVGRRFRKWWSSLPPERKNRYLGFLSKSRHRVIASFVAFVGLSCGYYMYHLEETPITGRKRFMIFSHDQLYKVSAIEWKSLDEGLEKLKLPVNDPMHKMVYNIVKRILIANNSKEVAAINWEVNVIAVDGVNAFVLGNGQIYVFVGMIKAVDNVDELAGVLGHEISHAILNHTAEKLSLSGFLNIYSVAIVALLWAIIPTDGFAVLASMLQSYVEDLLISLPYSRKLEREADEVGLLLAARACYDIRHVPKFWNRMQVNTEDGIPTNKLDWFSTHPANESRVKWLENLLPEALELRSDFQCPKLNEFFDVSKYMIKNY